MVLSVYEKDHFFKALGDIARDYSGIMSNYCDELKEKRELLLAAVCQYGGALWYASKALRADREIVLVAVSQNGFALKYASDELRGDREIVLAAVSQNGRAIEYVPRGASCVLAAARGTLSSCGLTANKIGLFAASISVLTGLGVILSYP